MSLNGRPRTLLSAEAGEQTKQKRVVHNKGTMLPTARSRATEGDAERNTAMRARGEHHKTRQQTQTLKQRDMRSCRNATQEERRRRGQANRRARTVIQTRTHTSTYNAANCTSQRHPLESQRRHARSPDEAMLSPCRHSPQCQPECKKADKQHLTMPPARKPCTHSDCAVDSEVEVLRSASLSRPWMQRLQTEATWRASATNEEMGPPRGQHT